ATARAKPAPSKPSRSACSLIASRALCITSAVLKIELRIVRHRRLARHSIGEERAERGTRFYARVPFRDRLILRPRNFTVIVECGEMRGKSEIGERYVSRGEKAVPVRELPERGEGPVQGLAPQAHHLHVGGGFDESTGLRLRRLLEDDAFGDFFVEVAYGPIEQ